MCLIIHSEEIHAHERPSIYQEIYKTPKSSNDTFNLKNNIKDCFYFYFVYCITYNKTE